MKRFFKFLFVATIVITIVVLLKKSSDKYFDNTLNL
jgi:hypothetical protein